MATACLPWVPEQIAGDQIDKRLAEAGWIVQDKKA
jgi:hypothetical protein